MKNWRQTLRYLITIGITGAVIPSNCFAQLYIWSNPSGGAFSNPGNWSPVGIPGSTGLTLFNLNSTYTVSFTNSPQNVGTIVNNGNVTFDIGAGNTYALASPVSSAIGTTSGIPASLTVTSGTLRFNTSQGDTGDSNSAGIATVAGSVGTLTITGPNSYLNAQEVFDIGVAGVGTLNVLNQATASIGNQTAVGSRGTGTIYVENSTLNLGTFAYIGRVGSGEVKLVNHSTGNFGPNLVLGHQAGSTGILTVGSNNSTGSHAVTNGVTIGNRGIGIASVVNHSLWSNFGTLQIGADFGSNGSVTISNNSRLSSYDSIFIGGSSIQQGGTGVLTVHSNSGIDVRGNSGITLWNAGTLNILNGGSVSASYLKNEGGTLNLSGGRLIVFEGGIQNYSRDLKVNGELAIYGGNLTHVADLHIGDQTTGSVNIDSPSGSSGANNVNVGVGANGNATLQLNTAFSANNIYLGLQGGTGIMTADGLGNYWVDGEFIVGAGGKGYFTVKPSTIFNSWGPNAIGGAGGTGVVNITGQWNTFVNIEIGKASSLSSSLAQSATLNISGAVTGNSLALYSPGTINMNGGILSITSLAALGGVVNFNAGTVSFRSNWNANYDQVNTLLGSSHQLRNGQLLEVLGTTTLQTYLEMNGGILRTSYLYGGYNLNWKSGQLQLTDSDFIVGGGSSTLDYTVTLSPNKQLSVMLYRSIIIETDGLLQMSGGQASAGTILNHGEIQLASSSSRLGATGPDFWLNNTGRISGTGRVLSNLSNEANGRIIVDAGQRMVFAGEFNQNKDNGTIELSGGTIEFNKTLTNETGGFISGRGTFRGSSVNTSAVGLINNGSVAFSAGISDIYGKVINNPDGRIIVAGASTLTFHDDMVHNGAEIRTGFGSRTVFLGAATGAGPYTGTGTVEFQGDLRPGNSPANIHFAGNIEIGASATTHFEIAGMMPGVEYDRLTVAGTVILDGTLQLSLLNGFLPEVNSAFLLIDNTGSGPIIGMFSNLPEGTHFTSDGQLWTISYQGGTGNDLVLTAVPEPATWALLASAVTFGGAYWYRRNTHVRRMWETESDQ